MTKWKVNDIAVFSGYTDLSITDDQKILFPGDRVTIVAVDKDGSMAAVPIVGDGEDPRDGDTVYNDEIMTVDDWVAKIDAEKGVTTAETVDPEVQADEEAAAAPNKTKAKDVAKAAKKASAKKAAITPAPEPEAAQASEQPEEADTGSDVLEVSHASSVQEMLAEKDALDAAKELVNRADETDFTLGGVLSVIQRDGIHQRLGYQGKRGFEDYIEKELGVKYRKARYLIGNYEYFTALGIDEKRLSAIGWSKVKELVGVATKENFDELVEYATNNSRDALIEHIRTSHVNAGDGSATTPTAKLTKLTFSLFDDQATTVNRALDAAKAQAQTDAPGAALEYICAEWSLMSANNETTLEEQIELLQARFGVTLSVVGEAQASGVDAAEGEESQEAAA